MTATAAQVLEQFRKLPAADQQELTAAILRETSAKLDQPGSRRKTIGEIAGQYRPQIADDAKDHDRGFAEAVAACKTHAKAPGTPRKQTSFFLCELRAFGTPG